MPDTSSFTIALCAFACAHLADAQQHDPVTFSVDKHANYSVTTDGWPYAFLPDSGGFYMLVGGMERAPKALRYDSTGHKGSPRTGIDLTRRSSDMAAWRMEDGKIFNVVFGPPDPNGEKPEEKDGEVIWGFVDPLKKDPAVPNTIGTVRNSDRAAPLAWSAASFLADGHSAIWVVPHMKKKVCTAIAVAVVDWRKGTVRAQDVNLSVPLEGVTAYHAAANEAGDVLLAISGTDPAVKKDGWSELVHALVGVKADGTVARHTLKMNGYFAGCTACTLDNSGQADCVAFAAGSDKSGAAIARARFAVGQPGAIEWGFTALDEDRVRQLCDRSREPKELEENKADKADPKQRSLALAAALSKLRPIELERRDDGSLLWVAEIQVRNEGMGDASAAAQAGNIRDQLLYAVMGADGTVRAGVVRKFIVESGAPGYGRLPDTSVLWKGDRIWFFFNDWEHHAWAMGTDARDRYGRINVATLEGAGIFDPMVHVEGPEGPIERTPIQRSMQMDYMMPACAVPCGDGAMLIALTKGRGVQWMKVEALP